MAKKLKKGWNSIDIVCIFDGKNRTRDFTTIHNLEATNMLANKLKKLGIKNKKGRLIFQFRF